MPAGLGDVINELFFKAELDILFIYLINDLCKGKKTIDLGCS